MLPESLEFDEAAATDTEAYPITLKIRHLSDHESKPMGYTGETGGTRSGLFRGSLLSAAEEEAL